MAPRILLLLSQLPHDPASGAARSMRTIAEFLAAGRMEVRALATTASEAGDDFDARAMLNQRGVKIESSNIAGLAKTETHVWRFGDRGVSYQLLDTGRHRPATWELALGATFDQLFDASVRDFQPDIVFTFGGSPAEAARRKRARAAGCKVVFGLRNWGYLQPGALEEVDALLTGSAFLTATYRRAAGVDSVPLPLPMEPEEVVAAEHERLFISYINPSVEKGVFFAARLFEELSRARPDVPIMTVESRGAAGNLVAAGLAGGFDLRRHENVMVSRPTTRPAEIFALARAVIVPSVWEEPAGRVAAEALMNGIPPLVSDRGGLAEVCAGGGFILPLPGDLTLHTRTPVAADAVRPWVDLLLRMVDDEAFYADACARAAKAGETYDRQRVAAQYCAFFEALLTHKHR